MGGQISKFASAAIITTTVCRKNMAPMKAMKAGKSVKSMTKTGTRRIGRGGSPGGQEGQVHHPRRVHGEDPLEAGDEGWQARSVRQGRDGQGQASPHHRQGVPRRCPQEVGVDRLDQELSLSPPPLCPPPRSEVSHLLLL